MKKFVSLLLLVSLLITSSISTVSAATPKESTVKKAYVSYLQKAIKNAEYGDDILYSLFDFNKDGVRELVVSFQDGARATYDVYTYYKGKVVSLGKNIGSIGYIENKKYLVSYGSGGYNNYSYGVYAIKGNKLKKVTEYRCDKGVYKKDKKKITKEEIDAFGQTVIYDLGESNKVSKKYYSPKKLGVSLLEKKSKYTKIVKADKNKIYYKYYKLGEESMTTWESKQMSAKITKDTKFYCGDLAQYSADKSKDTDSRAWIYEMGKAQFLKKMETYYGGSDLIVVKNGKVVKVFIGIKVAG